MNDSQLMYYKGYSVKSLVFKNKGERGSADDRTYEVVVRIEKDGDKESSAAVFRMAGAHIFYSLGEARRAGQKFGRDIIDGGVEGCSLGNAGDSAKS